MRLSLIKLLLLSQVMLLSSASAQQWDGPFGLQMGLSVSQLQDAIPDLQKIDDHFYSFRLAPKHYPGTDVYLATFSAVAGLCRVRAISFVDSSGFGSNVKTKFSNIEEAITNKYGPPTNVFNYVSPASLWSKPEDWMMSLLKEDRSLMSFWVKSEDKKNQLKLPESLSSISVETKGRSPEVADVILDYEFSNISFCVEESDQRIFDAL